MTTLRLDRLALTNFRCFSRCDIEFHPDLTVLVAENGSGKTAVLDAAATALSVIVNSLNTQERIRRIERSDVRLIRGDKSGMKPDLPTEYEAYSLSLDTPVTWKSTVTNYGPKVRPSTQHLRPAQQAALQLRTEADALPLIAVYGTARLWGEQRLTEVRRTSVTNVEERVAGYADCLTSASSYKGLSAWYEHRVKQTKLPAYKESLSTNLAMLQGVRAAADLVLGPTGWSNLHWDEEFGGLTAEHQKNGLLPLLYLSDGVRTMLALVADVARRCVSLNPALGERAPSLTPGILMIDEVDMHLHPLWQQQVLGLLRKAFPKLQIIVSTHSPHVLSTVDNSSIRVLHINEGDAMVETPARQTRGVESADVLAAVMDVDPVPQIEEVAALSSYRALIEDGKADTPEALDLRKKVVAHFGETHPVVLECDRLIRFQNFRVRKSTPEDS